MVTESGNLIFKKGWKMKRKNNKCKGADYETSIGHG